MAENDSVAVLNHPGGWGNNISRAVGLKPEQIRCSVEFTANMTNCTTMKHWKQPWLELVGFPRYLLP